MYVQHFTLGVPPMPFLITLTLVHTYYEEFTPRGSFSLCIYLESSWSIVVSSYSLDILSLTSNKEKSLG